MAISRSTAARLCTKPELELVDASTPANTRQLSPARLRQKVERARKLRDKYRDLAKRQRLESRGKADPRSTRAAQGNENTTRKAELFDEVLQRFQKQLDRTGSSAAATGVHARGTARSRGEEGGAQQTGATKTGAPKAATKKAGAKKAGAKKAGAKKAGAKKAGAKKAGAKKAGAKKAGRTLVGRAPAEGKAQPAKPGRPGAAALKGARQRPDARQQAQPKVTSAHNRASGQRSQSRRDSRNKS